MITLVFGVMFLCIKAYEYNHEFAAGYTPIANLFWSFYFIMTGLHGLHVVGGMVGIAIVAMIFLFGNPERKRKPRASRKRNRRTRTRRREPTLTADAAEEDSEPETAEPDQAELDIGSAEEDPDRGVTLLDLAAWQRAVDELGAEVDPVERRANLLVEGIPLQPVPGATLRVGTALLEVTRETDPCVRMDEKKPGLFAALARDARGGVCCRVIESGSARAGDTVVWDEA